MRRQSHSRYSKLMLTGGSNNNTTNNNNNALLLPQEDLDYDTLRDMEDKLSVKLHEYTTQLRSATATTAAAATNNVNIDDFGEMAKHVEKREEMERDYPNMALASAVAEDNTQNEHVSTSELYGTEEMFIDITSDFRTIIIGLCSVAESLCLARRLENNHNPRVNNGDDDSGDHHYSSPEIGSGSGSTNLNDYTRIMSRVENYLEAYESFYRNRVETVKRGKKLVENPPKNTMMNVENTVLRDVGSFLKGVFTNPLSKSSASPSSEFDETWLSADGTKKSINDITQLGEITPSNYDELIKAHRNQKAHPDISLYEHLLSANSAAYCFGNKPKADATEKSNRLLTRWISLYCLQKTKGGDDITASESNNPHNDADMASSEQTPEEEDEHNAKYPEQRLFHIVMRQNTDLWSKDGSQRAEEWLRRMESLRESGHARCAPDIHAYNLVLLSYCNLCKVSSSNTQRSPQAYNSSKPRSGGTSFEGPRERSQISGATRKFVLQGTEKILTELHDLDGVEANVLSLNLALNTMAKAGRNETDLCQRTDKLLQMMLGQDGFNALIDEATRNNAEPSKLEPDMDTYHWLINIYSTSGRLFYIERAMAILDKMIQMRKELALDNESDYDIPTPSTGTFNNALRALQCKVDELGRQSRLSEAEISLLDEETQRELRDVSHINIAKSLSPVIDAMVQFESSLPSRVTFLFMLQIWARSGSPDAGDQAEELLSRMETISSYNPITPFSNAYKLVLQSWLTSAVAGRRGAVERAHRLLEAMEAQTGIPVTKQSELSDVAIGIATEGKHHKTPIHFNVFDETQHDYGVLYPKLLKICATARGIEDTSRAVEIAFHTYDKMLKRGIKPRGKFFELMFTTVHNYCQHHPDVPDSTKKRLENEIFAAAEKNKVSRGELRGRIQQVQLRTETETADSKEEDSQAMLNEEESETITTITIDEEYETINPEKDSESIPETSSNEQLLTIK